jgi:hypothetical protein
LGSAGNDKNQSLFFIMDSLVPVGAEVGVQPQPQAEVEVEAEEAEEAEEAQQK